jgi:hypothetical protein
MSIQGKWRIVEMSDYETDLPDMMGPAYILTGAIHGTVKGDTVEFTRSCNDEMEDASGDDGPSSKRTGHSKGRFVSKVATQADGAVAYYSDSAGQFSPEDHVLRYQGPLVC